MSKMTPTPWKIRFLHKDEPESDFFIEALKTNPKAGYNIEIMGSEDGPNYTYEQSINPEAVPGLLKALDNILLDAEPLKGGEQVAIPSISISLIKRAIEKSKLPTND